MIERITHDQREYAIIIRSDFNSDGVNFFTPHHYSQQLAYMKRTAGEIIDPHFHNQVRREVTQTQEVLWIKSGRVRVDYYTEDKTIFESSELIAGDVILLAFGGHGFEILEEAEIIEVKQGPYSGDEDKTRFDPN